MPTAQTARSNTHSDPATLSLTPNPGPRIASSAPIALRTLSIEISGLQELSRAFDRDLGQAFDAAVELIAGVRGRIIVTGLGKSGHIGQKLAATFASTGTPAFFVHPTEASHGDLGMITTDDVLLVLSWSGETVELANVIAYAARFSIPLVSITSSSTSALGRASNIVLQLPRAEEACPHRLAPTTSTTMQLAVGDCLAIALLEAKGFTARDFKVLHPGGSLGAQLKLVREVMHTGDGLPLLGEHAKMSEALVVMTQKSFGCLGVVDQGGRLVGIVTDGDLRRNMGDGLLQASVSAVMTRNPKTIDGDTLASVALEQINAARITALFVVSDGRPIGLLHIHDLLRLGVI